MLLMHLVLERDSPYVNPTYNNSKNKYILLNCKNHQTFKLNSYFSLSSFSESFFYRAGFSLLLQHLGYLHLNPCEVKPQTDSIKFQPRQICAFVEIEGSKLG